MTVPGGNLNSKVATQERPSFPTPPDSSKMSEMPELSEIKLELGGYEKEFLINPKPYTGTSLTRKCTPLGPYRRSMPRVLGGS